MTYTFDISDAVNLEFSIDIAAQGNFESTDASIITASIDGGDPLSLIGLFPDDNTSQEYFFENGSSVTVDDPMSANALLLDNGFQNFTIPIFETGSILTIEFIFTGNGPGEQVVLDNLVIRGDSADTFMIGDVNCDGVVDLLDIGPFVDALINDVFDEKADINGDGADDLLDIADFVDLLISG